MLDIKVHVRSAKDAEELLLTLRTQITASKIPATEQDFLLDAVASILETWRLQLSALHTKTFIAEKRLAGNGYRVTLTAHAPTGGVLTTLKRLIARA